MLINADKNYKMIVLYSKVVSKDEVKIYYVDIDDNTLLHTENAGQLPFGYNYTFTAPSKYNDPVTNAVWELAEDSPYINWTVLETGNKIVIKYRKTMGTVVVQYVDAADPDHHILRELDPVQVQVGFSYQVPVLAMINSGGAWTVAESMFKIHEVKPDNQDNIVKVKYTQGITSERVVTIYYFKVITANMFNLVLEYICFD